MRKTFHFLILPTFILTTLQACSYGEKNDISASISPKNLSEISPESISALSKRSFYFGHQSVGKNLTEGLAMILPEYPDINLRIIEGESPQSLVPGVFLHSRIGQNKYPATKILAFEKIMDSGIGERVDAAFVKFCYVDAIHGTDIDSIFEQYRKTMDTLKSRYPDTIFVHFTMPLKSLPNDFTSIFKKVLGQDIPAYQDNAARAYFNDLIRSNYLGNEPVFDIARLESTLNGQHGYSEYKGMKLEFLARPYTYDGGHLSEQGKRWLAEQLLAFLAELNYRRADASLAKQ